MATKFILYALSYICIGVLLDIIIEMIGETQFNGHFDEGERLITVFLWPLILLVVGISVIFIAVNGFIKVCIGALTDARDLIEENDRKHPRS